MSCRSVAHEFPWMLRSGAFAAFADRDFGPVQSRLFELGYEVIAIDGTSISSVESLSLALYASLGWPYGPVGNWDGFRDYRAELDPFVPDLFAIVWRRADLSASRNLPLLSMASSVLQEWSYDLAAGRWRTYERAADNPFRADYVELGPTKTLEHLLTGLGENFPLLSEPPT